MRTTNGRPTADAALTRRLVLGSASLVATFCLFPNCVHGFATFGASEYGLFRWDAAPRTVDGVERSLDGGLRYSLQGGSYEAYRDLMDWTGAPPRVADFQAAIEQAFAVWEVTDPTTGLGTDLRFVPDLDTPIVAEPNLGQGLNGGAEIDLAVSSRDWNGSRAWARPWYDPDHATVTLTSGVEDYPALVASGVDIFFSDQRPLRDLDHFQTVLTHEIGHAIGLGDVDKSPRSSNEIVFSGFYDDNYDETNHHTAKDTLTNSFADLIDPFDPDNSAALSVHNICQPKTQVGHCFSDPGVDSLGVELLMESSPTKTDESWGTKLQNDEFAGRQFLYPVVLCDVDGNGTCDAQDIDAMTQNVIDGNDSAEQRALLIEREMPHGFDTYIGDSNLDGQFDEQDFVTVFDAGKYLNGEYAGWAEGDWNGDFLFDEEDFVAAFAGGGYLQGPRVAAVPEPSSLTLALLTLVALMTRRGSFSGS